MNIVCVCVNGYPASAVRALNIMCRKETKAVNRFVVITDNPVAFQKDEDIQAVEAKDIWLWKGWWQKLQLFNIEAMHEWGLEGRWLYLDLDNIILDDLKKLTEEVTEDELWISPEFYTGAQRDHRGNSSVMYLKVGANPEIWDAAERAAADRFKKWKGDQDLINQTCKTKRFFEPDLCISMKKDVIAPEQDLRSRTIRDPHRPLYKPHEAVVVVCHGFKPWEELSHPFFQTHYPMTKQQVAEVDRQRRQMTIGPMKVRYV